MSEYKSRYPDDTDKAQDIGLSSDEATGMEEQVGVARRITVPKPSPRESTAAVGRPSDAAGPAGPPEGSVKLGSNKIVINKGVLRSIKRGAELALKGNLPSSFASTTATSGDVPFEIPQPAKHAVHCDMCQKDFPTSKALRRHLRLHKGETHHMCKKCGKHLTSSHMMDMHEISCGSTEFAHNCKACGSGYHTKQALVQHLKVHHPPASKEECTCPDCKVEFKLVKTMREHRATHRGPFQCPVEDCPAIFSLPKHRNCYLREKHGFDAKRY